MPRVTRDTLITARNRADAKGVLTSMKRAGRIVGDIVTVLLVLVLTGAFALVFVQRDSGEGGSHFGQYFAASVLSGSMTPHIDTGDVVVDRLVTPRQAAKLHIGQIVTYRLATTFDGKPMLITHRIVGIVTVHVNSKVSNLYQTKGDANNAPDGALVRPDQVVGVFALRLPYAGYLGSFVHRPLGFGVLIGIPALYLIGEQFLSLWKALEESERRRAASTAAGSGGEKGR